MKSNTSTFQKIGRVIFTISAVYMFGLGWLYSWRVVPAANQFGSVAYSGLLGFLWGLSVPLGAFTVAIGAGKTGSDLRMVGFIFFVVATWYLCGIFGMGNYVLRPELADRFSVPIGSTINAASFVQLLLVMGWGFTFFGQLISRQAQAIQPEVDKVPQIAAAD